MKDLKLTHPDTSTLSLSAGGGCRSFPSRWTPPGDSPGTKPPTPEPARLRPYPHPRHTPPARAYLDALLLSGEG